jgi:GT2 family glycosyltransferase
MKTAPAVRIVVVDNNSDKEYQRDDVIVIRNNDRHAVSGMNFGFYFALYELGAEFVVNFDNDIICLNGWLEPLIREMDKDKKIGIIGGKQWMKDMSMFRSVGMDMVGGTLYGNAPDKTMEVYWLQGSFVMLRAEMMKMIGLHDERFKILCSDSDYCFHAKDRGWKVVFVEDSNVIHIGGASYTSVCESWEEDNKALLRKWTGQSGMRTLAGLPLSKKENRSLRVAYKVVEND